MTAMFPRDLIRTYQDFPKPGIRFRDVMPILADALAFSTVSWDLAEKFRPGPPSAGLGPSIDKVIGLEARGFIFGVAVARVLKTGFVPFRKPGKLPGPISSASYNLEYGNDKLEVQDNALKPGDTVLIVDDLLATGGTALAAIELAQERGAKVVGCSFVVELVDLKGGEKIADRCPYESLYKFTENE